MTNSYGLPEYHGELNSFGVCQCDYCYKVRLEMKRTQDALDTSWERGEDHTRFIFAIDYGF
jgi:hypothetical protein